MAGLSNDGGRFRLIVTKRDGSRTAVRLGERSAEDAEKIRGYVNDIEDCRAMGMPERIAAATVGWLKQVEPELWNKLAKAEIVPSRAGAVAVKKERHTVAELVADVLESLGHAKASTQRNYRQIASWLKEYFPPQREVATIKRRDADAMIAWLRNPKGQDGRGGKGMGRATVARAIKAFRMFFKKAMEWERTDANPFVGIKAGDSVNASRRFNVSREVFDKVMAATKDREFRVVLALSRFGALRCPSEVVALKWEDVIFPDEERDIVGRLTVHATKTEGHEGGGVRTLPLFPELAAVLADHLGALTLEGRQGEYVVTDRSATKNWRTRLKKLLRDHVGVAPWPRLFHNMRASRESELYRTYPLDTVSRWLGHSAEIAAKHYLFDPDGDENFRKASGAESDAAKAARQTARQGAKKDENAATPETVNQRKTPENIAFPGLNENQTYPRRDSNPCFRRERAAS